MQLLDKNSKAFLFYFKTQNNQSSFLINITLLILKFESKY